MIARWGALLLGASLLACGASNRSGHLAEANHLLDEEPPREVLASAPEQPVEVDLEVPTPSRAAELRQRGVQLPKASERSTDPRQHRDFVERRVNAVGFGITAGGYILFGESLPRPILVPESQVDFGLVSTEPVNSSIYPDREAALTDIAAEPPARGHPPRHAYYRGAGGTLIVPTVFSPATTPRIVQTMLEVRRQLAEDVQRELKVTLLTLTGTKILSAVLSRVVQLSTGTGSRPLARIERLGNEPPTLQPSPPSQSVPRQQIPAVKELDWDSVVPTKGKYAGQDRRPHVQLHNIDNLSKPSHGVFFGDGVTVTNEAWLRAQALCLEPNSTGRLTVPMGRQVGWLGGREGSAAAVPLNSVTIIIKPGTNQIITAYPDL